MRSAIPVNAMDGTKNRGMREDTVKMRKVIDRYVSITGRKVLNKLSSRLAMSEENRLIA